MTSDLEGNRTLLHSFAPVESPGSIPTVIAPSRNGDRFLRSLKIYKTREERKEADQSKCEPESVGAASSPWPYEMAELATPKE